MYQVLICIAPCVTTDSFVREPQRPTTIVRITMCYYVLLYNTMARGNNSSEGTPTKPREHRGPPPACQLSRGPSPPSYPGVGCRDPNRSPFRAAASPTRHLRGGPPPSSRIRMMCMRGLSSASAGSRRAPSRRGEGVHLCHAWP